MIKPSTPEPIPGLYDTFAALAMAGRELGAGPYAGAMSTLPEGVEDYLYEMGINPENIKAITLGIAWGRNLP